MITWMQQHKKWLIVTIWVSTIAFVGAGFVGWGSYDYGKSNSAVALVNGKEVPMRDLQNEYSALYSQYSQIFGSSFNQELAKQFKLEDAALQKVIQKYLYINFADEIGLAVTDKELAKQLVEITAFQKDGKFDKNTYMSVLKQNRRSTSEFEAQLKQDLLIQKIQKVFNIKLEENEIKNISELIFLQDKVEVAVVDSENIKVDTKASDIKKHWEITKENYKSPEGYKISYKKVVNIDEKSKKQMKQIALKHYVNLKKAKESFKEEKIIFENSDFVASEDFKKIKTAEASTILKPIYKDGNYYIIKLLSKTKPQTLPFDEVKSDVKKNYITDIKNKLLKEKADKIVNNFKGISLGYIQKDSQPTIKGLNENESQNVVRDIFNSTSKISQSNLGDKIVVFRITDSKLAAYDSKNDQIVKSAVEKLKNNEINNGLISKLRNKYEIKTFIGKN
ncbi:MAG: SurA N-terminal domain-containing protein [Campylobacterota bacterium]|nr:SurA N-terminal domain-containing protein [Campylobacterota bacterium]